MLTYFIIIIKIIIYFGFYNLTICILCGNLMVGRANAPLKLLASDRNNRPGYAFTQADLSLRKE